MNSIQPLIKKPRLPRKLKKKLKNDIVKKENGRKITFRRNKNKGSVIYWYESTKRKAKQ